MKLSEVDRSKLAPMMKHYVEMKDNYKDVLLFYRLGDFYEMFFEDAVTVSHELELTLTGRAAGLEERVPMCGVPYHAVNVYIDKLIKKGYKVAICEQMEDPKTAKGIVKRDITEVISSGTVTSESSLNEKENNFIGNIYDFDYMYVISYSDITTGEYYIEKLDHDKDKVLSEVISLGLKEVICNSKLDPYIINILKSQYKLTVTITDKLYELDNYSYLYNNFDVNYQIAIKHLLYYLVVEQRRNLSHIRIVIEKKQDNYLKMDVHTKRNLELTESLRLKERQYSLLWLMDNTKTAMGGRKLKQWIENPIIDKDILNQRYERIINRIINKSKTKIINLNISIEDLQNECLELFHQSIENYSNMSKACFNTYVTLLVDRKIKKTILNQLRKERKSSIIFLTDLLNNNTNIEQKLCKNIKDPLEILCQKEKINQLHQTIEDNLNKKEINVLILLLKGFKYSDISRVIKKDYYYTYRKVQTIKRKLIPKLNEFFA